MKILFVILSFAFCLFASSSFTFGQICPKFPCVVDSEDSGEVASAAIDNFLAHIDGSSERIFVIARLGSQETSSKSNLNLNRLCDARDYILWRFSGQQSRIKIDSLSTIFAEGEGIKGEGRIEFYLGSKLLLTRIIKRNREANLNCCGELTPTERKQKQKDCSDWKKMVHQTNH